LASTRVELKELCQELHRRSEDLLVAALKRCENLDWESWSGSIEVNRVVGLA
jgi:hypothetical protein